MPLRKCTSSHILVSDFDHRDPKSELDDIDTGRYLEALGSLPQNIRQLMQEGDMHVQVEQLEDGTYRVVKIIKKREPEFLQGTDHFFVIDKEGQRLEVEEDTYSELLGLKGDPEDVFNREDVEFVGLEYDQVPPMDVWDITFDETEHVRTARRLIDSGKASFKQLQKQADKLVYSADWFPYSEDKRLRHARAQLIATKITKEDLSKKELARLIGYTSQDKRPSMATQLLEQAKKMKPSTTKQQILSKAKDIMDSYKQDKDNPVRDRNKISAGDRRKLWHLWQERYMKLHESVELPPWRYKTMLQYKLTQMAHKGKITWDEARYRLMDAMEKHFGIREDKTKIRMRRPTGRFAKVKDINPPEWLTDIPKPEEVEVSTEEFNLDEWLPESTYLQLTDEEDQCDTTEIILSQGLSTNE